MQRIFLFFLCLVLWGFGGTGCSVSREAVYCEVDLDCKGGEICQEGFCVPVAADTGGQDLAPDLPEAGGDAEPDTFEDAADASVCSPGQLRCESEQSYSECAQSGEEWVWGAATPCDSLDHCVEGQCQCNCANPFSCNYSIELCERGEFWINSYTSAEQAYPYMALIDDTRFVVVWSSMNQDSSSGGIYGRIFSRDGQALTSEFQINVHTTGNQYYSQVAMLNPNQFVVVWQSEFQDGDGFGVYGRIFNSNGGAIHSREFPVNLNTAGWQANPQLLVLDTNRFVVVWESYKVLFPGYVDHSQIYYRIFDPTGQGSPTEYKVNIFPTNNFPSWPQVKKIDNTLFGITWNYYQNGTKWNSVCGRFFDSQGTPLSSNEFQINQFTAESQWFPQFEVLTESRMVVIWNSLKQDSDAGWSVYGRIVKRDGSFISSPFRVNVFNQGWQKMPVAPTNFYHQVKKIDPTRFFVVWESEGQNDDYSNYYNIYGRFFDSSGNGLSSDILVNQKQSEIQNWPQVAILSDSRILVVWHDFERLTYNNGRVYGAIFDSQGNRLYPDFMVNISTNGKQLFPLLEPLDLNRFAVIWYSGDITVSPDQKVTGEYDLVGRIFYFE